MTGSVMTSLSFLTPLLDLGICFFEQQPPDLEWNRNFVFRVLIIWGMVKQVVLQAAHEKSAKPLTENRYNKMRSSGHRRRWRQGMTFNIRQSVVPLANGIIL